MVSTAENKVWALAGTAAGRLKIVVKFSVAKMLKILKILKILKMLKFSNTQITQNDQNAQNSQNTQMLTIAAQDWLKIVI